MKKVISIVVLSLLLYSVSNSQETTLNRLSSVGFLFSYPITEEKLPESISNGYAPILLQGNFRFPLIKNNGKHQLTFLVQPQFNPVKKINKPVGGVNFSIGYHGIVPLCATPFATSAQKFIITAIWRGKIILHIFCCKKRNI